jgi:hypothetical protein
MSAMQFINSIQQSFSLEAGSRPCSQKTRLFCRVPKLFMLVFHISDIRSSLSGTAEDTVVPGCEVLFIYRW